MASAPQPQGASGTQRDRVAQEIIKKKKKVRPMVMQGTPLRRSRGSRSGISLMASPPPGSPDYLSSVSPDESLKLIQSYCQSLK